MACAVENTILLAHGQEQDLSQLSEHGLRMACVSTRISGYAGYAGYAVGRIQITHVVNQNNYAALIPNAALPLH